jgi:hypothetical protein
MSESTETTATVAHAYDRYLSKQERHVRNAARVLEFAVGEELTEMLSTAQLARIGAAMMIAAHRGLLAAYDEEEEALVSEAYL